MFICCSSVLSDWRRPEYAFACYLSSSRHNTLRVGVHEHRCTSSCRSGLIICAHCGTRTVLISTGLPPALVQIMRTDASGVEDSTQSYDPAAGGCNSTERLEQELGHCIVHQSSGLIIRRCHRSPCMASGNGHKQKVRRHDSHL